jgi:hypothetical protein
MRGPIGLSPLPYTDVSPYPLIQYPRFTAAPQNGKIKEINGSYVLKRARSENGP